MGLACSPRALPFTVDLVFNVLCVIFLLPGIDHAISGHSLHDDRQSSRLACRRYEEFKTGHSHARLACTVSVFFFMGLTALGPMQFWHRMQPSLCPETPCTNYMGKKRIHLYVAST